MSLVDRFMCKRKEQNYYNILRDEVETHEDKDEGDFENEEGSSHVRSCKCRLSNERNANQFNVNEMSLDAIDVETYEFNETFWSNFSTKAQKIELKMNSEISLRCRVEGVDENMLEVTDTDVDVRNRYIYYDNSDNSNYAY